ncbi:hypothetical protein ACTXT7_007603 [Hymenolepis weldensis]
MFQTDLKADNRDPGIICQLRNDELAPDHPISSQISSFSYWSKIGSCSMGSGRHELNPFLKCRQQFTWLEEGILDPPLVETRILLSLNGRN